MGTSSTTEPSSFGLAVRTVVVAELNMQGWNAFKLSTKIGRSATYLNARITHAERELSLSDLEMICSVLGTDITPIIEKAEYLIIARETCQNRQEIEKIFSADFYQYLRKTGILEEFADAQGGSGGQSSYSLAAKHDPGAGADINDEDYF